MPTNQIFNQKNNLNFSNYPTQIIWVIHKNKLLSKEGRYTVQNLQIEKFKNNGPRQHFVIKNIESKFQMDKIAKKLYFESISEFKILDKKRLGKGSFGEVRLALHLQTNKVYAIKIIDTKEITSVAAYKALEREITLHSQISHPHIIRLWQVLKQDTKIYMVMEFAERGNLFFHQNSKRIFTEQEASIFFSQTLSAVEYLHNLNLIHRDIKPENLLLDKDLNIKICDLGWVVEGAKQNHRTFCGTYQYMAPEMIFDRSYGHEIDIWALGILLYELLHGYAPFQGETVEQVRQSMMLGEINIDPELSQEVQNLIFNILKVDPKERLTAEQIKAHSWIIQMNNKRLVNSLIQESQNSEDAQQSSKKKRMQKTSLFDLKLHSMKKENVQGSQNKTDIFAKQRKNSDPKMKTNISIENLGKGSKLKQKQNIYKYLEQISKKKEMNHQRDQFSDISMNMKGIKLKTEANESKKVKTEMIRYGTEIGEMYENCDTKLNAKKRKMMPKRDNQSNMLKKSSKAKFIRQSMD